MAERNSILQSIKCSPPRSNRVDVDFVLQSPPGNNCVRMRCARDCLLLLPQHDNAWANMFAAYFYCIPLNEQTWDKPARTALCCVDGLACGHQDYVLNSSYKIYFYSSHIRLCLAEYLFAGRGGGARGPAHVLWRISPTRVEWTETIIYAIANISWWSQQKLMKWTVKWEMLLDRLTARTSIHVRHFPRADCVLDANGWHLHIPFHVGRS